MWVAGPQCYETSKVGFISKKKTRSKKEINYLHMALHQELLPLIGWGFVNFKLVKYEQNKFNIF